MAWISPPMYYGLITRLVRKCDEISNGKLNRKKDYLLFGEGSGVDEPYSLRKIMRAELEKRNYSFKGHHYDYEKSQYKLSLQPLRKAKNNYNQRKTQIFVSDQLISACLFFLELEDREDFILKGEEIPDKIDLTTSSKPSAGGRRDFGIIGDYAMYTYNGTRDKIIVAHLKVFQENSQLRIILNNRHDVGFQYSGYIDKDLFLMHTLILSLTTATHHKKIHAYLHWAAPAEPKPEVLLGYFLSTNENYEIISGPALLYRQDPAHLQLGILEESSVNSAIRAFITTESLQTIPKYIHSFESLEKLYKV